RRRRGTDFLHAAGTRRRSVVLSRLPPEFPQRLRQLLVGQGFRRLPEEFAGARRKHWPGGVSRRGIGGYDLETDLAHLATEMLAAGGKDLGLGVTELARPGCAVRQDDDA